MVQIGVARGQVSGGINKLLTERKFKNVGKQKRYTLHKGHISERRENCNQKKSKLKV